MPRFYFDIDDGERRSRDNEGTELAGPEDARREAIGVLPDIAREELPDGNRRTFACRVRDESDTVIFLATLSLEAEWIGPPPARPSA
jgi:hypothetical protein